MTLREFVEPVSANVNVTRSVRGSEKQTWTAVGLKQPERVVAKLFDFELMQRDLKQLKYFEFMQRDLMQLELAQSDSAGATFSRVVEFFGMSLTVPRCSLTDVA